MGLRVDHGHGDLVNLPHDFDDVGHRLPARLYEGHLVGVGVAKSVVVNIKVVAFPRDAVLPHPFATEDGFKRFAEAPACLDGKDQAVFNLAD